MSGVTPGPWRVVREHQAIYRRYTYAVIGTGDRPWVATDLSKANADEIARLHNEAHPEEAS